MILSFSQARKLVVDTAKIMSDWERSTHLVNDCYSCSFSVDWNSDVQGYFYRCNRCGLDTPKCDTLYLARSSWQSKRVNWVNVRAFHSVSEEIGS